MKNPIYKAYEKLDNAIMYGADKAAHAWNWTTGRTKANLANKLLAIAPILEISGTVLIAIPTAAFFAPFSLYFSHDVQKRNIQYEKLEEKAAENQIINSEVESYKQASKKFGYLITLPAAFDYSFFMLSYNQNKYPSLGFASRTTGFFLRSVAFHIMRTHYLPPRKNCLSRAKDKLAEILQERVLRPAPAPMPVPALNYLSLDYKI